MRERARQRERDREVVCVCGRTSKTEWCERIPVIKNLSRPLIGQLHPQENDSILHEEIASLFNWSV